MRRHISGCDEGALAQDSAAMFGEYGPMAIFALLCIPLFVVIAFRGRRPAYAAAIAALGSALFAPELAHIKLPMTPPLDKGNIAYLTMLVLVFVRFKRYRREQRPFTKEELFAAASAVACAITAHLNPDGFVVGTWERRAIPGMTFKDGMALALDDLFSIWAPFYIGRVFIREPRDVRDVLVAFVGAGLVYAPFMLWEMRMSPSLHYNLYGYPAHPDFAQSIRWGGYRPMVFMQHGLGVGLFAFAAASVAIVLVRLRENVGRWKAKHVAFFLAVLLVLCKSTGSIAYYVVAAPIFIWASPKAMTRVATGLAVLIIVYPALRAADIFPVEDVLDLFRAVSEERTQSLAFRFHNEDALLHRAQQRLIFGWGSYGRSLVFDRDSAKPITVADGQWIIWLGTRGLFGLLCFLGLVLTPVLRARRMLPKVKDPKLALMMTSVALLLAILTLDLIPNGMFSPYPLFLAGMLSSVTRRVAEGWRASAHMA